MTIKKITAILMLSVLPLGVLTAQDEKDYLPKAGDLAIGIDMQPIYSFFGNLANGDAGNGLGQFGGEDALGITGVSIMGKYMLDNTTALRVNLGVDKNLSHEFEYSIDDEAKFFNPMSESKVEDLTKRNRVSYSLSAGIEFRKGNNRIQGYYGGDLVLGLNKDHYTFTYGNAITDVNQAPSRNGYNGVGLGVNNVPYWTSTYITESFESTIFAGVAGKVGVEYFVVPKLAFGGEVSLLIGEAFQKGSYTKSEGYNSTTAQVEEHTELESPASRTFHIGTENMGGKLFMIFYF